MLDLSNYLKDSKLFDPVNEKAIGKMKDESKGNISDEFFGLKSKTQSIKYVDSKENKTGKVVYKIAVKNIMYEQNIDVLFSKKVVRHNMKRIQSKSQRTGTYDVSKISLPCFDDKTYILDDGIYTLAYFHKDTRSQ